ncbi:MAG: 3-hydroxy-3-methylglutaryl-CoA reductase, partial [Chloroflexi bacterium]|nr:3-hydroxy-3-methylglutaryl-CoA reductase [Chloroflexota bacterium]
MTSKSSRLEGFYKKSLGERARLVADWAELDQTDYHAIQDGGLSLSTADRLIENVIGLYSLPLGVATNFLINGKDYLIPMVIEEPSVVAACSFAAKLARAGGGFTAWATEPVMIAQIQVLDVPDLDAARDNILKHEADLLRQADALHPSIVARGGGARGIEVRLLPETA